MATEKRTSVQGDIFDAVTVRGFLLMALGHNAVIDRVNDLLFEHVVGHQYHSSVIAESLRPIIDEVLGVATFEDWDRVASALIEEAREALGEDSLNQAPGVQPPHKPQDRKQRLRSLDSGELREKLAEIYTHDFVSPSIARRAWWIIRKLSQLTGISRERIQADAKAQAEVMADYDNMAGAGQSSEHTPAEIAGTRRAEHEHVIETARNLDPQTFDIDTRLAQPGKYEGASDLPLVVALDIINGHGFADERTGDAAVSGYAWRVNRFVGIEDSQGFVSAEEHPTARHAAERLRDFDVPTEDEES